MEAARVTLLLLVALFNIQYLNAIIIGFCANKRNGNYLCPSDQRPDDTVCGCYTGAYCDSGKWYDPLLGYCSSEWNLRKKLINCMNGGGDLFNVPPPAADGGFCADYVNGNYLCNPSSDSIDICSCYNKDMCDDEEWYDPLLRRCDTLTNNVLARLTRCLGESVPDTTTIKTTTVKTTTVKTTTVKAADCPFDYAGPTVEGFCYKAILEAVTWKDAEARCKEDDKRAYPAYVLTSQQNEVIVNHLRKYRRSKIASVCDISHANLENYFIGGHRKNENECSLDKDKRTNEFEWRVGTKTIPFTDYTNWKEGEPNCSNGLVENCMAYRCGDRGGNDCIWLDYSCPSRACLVCQIKL